MRERPIIMGILNVTPDSFFDGGRHVSAPVARGLAMVEEGADWIDVGGESTRPGAGAVDAAEELRRVLPVIEALCAEGVTVSVDTTKPAVAAAAARAGAAVLNDVRGLQDPEMQAASADFAHTVIIHSRGTPETMGGLTAYGDLVAEVRDFLLAQAARCRSAEVWIDPGIGFAKRAGQSLALLRHLGVLVETGLPVLVGASRKSFIGHTLGLERAEDRLAGSLAAAAAAYHRGAAALRVHDVRATREVVTMLRAIAQAG